MTDCASVKIIYQKLGGDAANIHSWDCCSSKGIKCVENHVIGIDWSSRGLTGSIPPELANLENLQSL
jgi:hypothetical protein